MKKRLFTGCEIPCIGLGTFGSDKYTPNEVATAVDGAVRSGYRLLDCAAVYGNEQEIGKTITNLQQEGVVSRGDLFITSKVWNDRHHDVVAACRQSLADLGIDYCDLYLVHWPFPNYHAPGCSADSRNPDARPFSAVEFMKTWRQCEELVNAGLARHIGMSNMTITKLEQVLPQCRIQPAAIEMELHPSFQQQALFDYAVERNILPIGYCPIGSPSRPARDQTPDDVIDCDLPAVQAAAQAHRIHPALVCLKWAVQRGQIPIPFSVKKNQYEANLKCVAEDPLTQAEMAAIHASDQNSRLIKGQVFLWPEARDWRDLWDGEA